MKMGKIKMKNENVKISQINNFILVDTNV